MNRSVTRLSLLVGVVVLGLIAMAYAQWGSQSDSTPTSAAGAQAASGMQGDPAESRSQGGTVAAAADPFAATPRSEQPPTIARSFNERSDDASRSAVRVRPVNMQNSPPDHENTGAQSGAGGDPFTDYPIPMDEDGRLPGDQGASASKSKKPLQKSAFAGTTGGLGPANPLRNPQAPSNEFGAQGGIDNQSRVSSGNGSFGAPAGENASQNFAAPQTSLPALSNNQGGFHDGGSGLHPVSSNAPHAPPKEFLPGGGRDAPGRPISAAGGQGTPGGQQLEGSQRPMLVIQKFAPPEIQVNKPCTFEIHVRNTGETPARDVEVYDQVPKGTQFLASTPPAEPTPQGDLLWRFDALPPGDQRVIKLQLRPLARGEIGSVASVRFSADASVRSKCTCPELRVELAAPPQTLIGDQLALAIKVTNIGDGPATGVVIAEHVPKEFEHPQGQVLENELGTLKPQESRELKLTLRAVKPGRALNRLIAKADGEVRVEKELPLEIVAPLLALGVGGPKERILEREAVYEIALRNLGTAPAKVVQLTAHVPSGFKFVGANNYGAFDPKTRRVAWELVELPAGQNDRVELRLLPIEAGLHELVVEGRAQRNVQAVHKHGVSVDGVVNIQYQVDQPPTKSGALEVGGEAIYEIRVANNGSKPATNVQLAVLFPRGLEPLGGSGPVTAQANGDEVIFAALPKLAPRADTMFQVKARAQALGDHRVRFQIISAGMQPVIKDVSTPVQ